MNKYIDKGKVLKLMRDIVFKNVLKDTNNREFLAKIISIATKIDYNYLLDNIILTDTDTLEANIYNHHNTGDLVVIIENTKINIEASLDNKEINKRKNEIMTHKHASNSYKINDKYDKGYIHYQICIENYNIFNNDLVITEVNLVDVSSGNYEIETNEFKKFHICLNNLKEKCYNELTEEEQRYLKLFITDEIKELNKIAGENEIMKKVVKSLENLSGDVDMISAYEKEEIEKYAFNVALEEKKQEGKIEGRLEGISERNIEIAKNSLRENIDISIISKITGLTIEEIETLK